ncbi:hypothetical protein AAHB53_28085 [Niallia circulans]
MIDHDTIKLYQPYFKTYESIKQLNDICFYYEPKEWLTKEWKGLDAYIKYLDEEYYSHIYPDQTKLDYDRRICLVYNDNHYYVSLFSWLDGSAIQDGKINYIFWYGGEEK